MEQEVFSRVTPASLLVEVARLATPYRDRPEMLLDVVNNVQQIVPAVSEEVSAVIAREMNIPMTQVYSFVTFYAMLSVKPRGKYIVRMCKSAPCHIRGAKEVVTALEEQLGISMGETTEDGRFTLEYCPCLGICDISPAIMINNRTYGNLDAQRVRALIKTYVREDVE